MLVILNCRDISKKKDAQTEATHALCNLAPLPAASRTLEDENGGGQEEKGLLKG